ncbi:MAG: 50S ribosomal protein L32 [Chlamydiae bacterium]|nr:50S ribosomal protein L32 [Chlamydiota bacterium]MBI3266739.1 50S ribosomal protein L32 [Chlamydiota bacterium]
MALQTNRHSRSRRDKKRTHYKYIPLQTMSCPNCQQPVLPHRVCSNCGYYQGRQVLQAKVG